MTKDDALHALRPEASVDCHRLILSRKVLIDVDLVHVLCLFFIYVFAYMLCIFCIYVVYMSRYICCV